MLRLNPQHDNNAVHSAHYCHSERKRRISDMLRLSPPHDNAIVTLSEAKGLNCVKNEMVRVRSA